MSSIKCILMKFDKAILFQVLDQSKFISDGVSNCNSNFGIILSDSDGDKFYIGACHTIELRPRPTNIMSQPLKYAIYLNGKDDIRKNECTKINITYYDNNQIRDYWYEKFLNGLKNGILKISDFKPISID